MGDRQPPGDFEAPIFQQLTHMHRVKIKIHRSELDHLGLERIPILASQRVAQDRL